MDLAASLSMPYGFFFPLHYPSFPVKPCPHLLSYGSSCFLSGYSYRQEDEKELITIKTTWQRWADVKQTATNQQ